MNIKIKTTPSESQRTFTVSLSELGYTEKDWLKLSQEQQQTIVQTYLDDMPDQPYWAIDEFELA